MPPTTCQFCLSQGAETRTSNNDMNVISNFLNFFIPKIDLFKDPSLPVSVCQTCFMKAKTTLKFIALISETQTSLFKNNKSELQPEHLLSSPFQEMLKKQMLPPPAEKSQPRKRKFSKSEEFYDLSEDNESHAVVDFGEEIKTGRSFENQAQSNENKSESISICSSQQIGYSDSSYEQTSSSKRQKLNKLMSDIPIKFTCENCKIPFEDFLILSEHLKSKSCITYVHECTTCETKFGTKKFLQKHSATHKMKTLPTKTFMYDVRGSLYTDLHGRSESIQFKVEKQNYFFRSNGCLQESN